MFRKVAVIVLASGLSRRMGSNKMLLKLGGKPILIRTIRNFSCLFSEIILVSAPNENEISMCAKEVSKIAVNSKPEEGLSRSIRIGLLCLSSKLRAFFLALGDQPFLAESTLRLMVRAYREKRPKIVVPVYRGIRGNPVLFDISMVETLTSSLEGDKGARDVIEKHLNETLFLELNDRGISLDIDTPLDLKKAKTIMGGKG